MARSRDLGDEDRWSGDRVRRPPRRRDEDEDYGLEPPPRRRAAGRTIAILLSLLVLVGLLGGSGYYAWQAGWLTGRTTTRPQQPPAAETREAAAAPAAPRPPAAEPPRPVRIETTVLFDGRADTLEAADGNTVEPGAGSEATAVIRSSVRTASPSGATGGVAVTIPAELSATLAGRRVRLTVTARSADATPAQFALAYSLATGATSGWLVFTPTAEFAPYSLDFTVPGEAAGTHFVGLWSDIAGRGAALEVKSVSIAVPR